MCYLLEPSARWMSIPEPTAGLSPLCSSCVVLSTTRALCASTDATPPKLAALPSIVKYNSMIVGGIVQLFVLSASGFSSLSARYARLRPAEQPSGFASPARERLQGVHYPHVRVCVRACMCMLRTCAIPRVPSQISHDG